MWPIGLQNKTLQPVFRDSALLCSPITACYQPAGSLDCSKNYLFAILKFLLLPQSPRKTCSGRYRLVLKEKLREVKMVRILGQPFIVFYRFQFANSPPETQRSSLLKMTAHIQS